ncbi:MAG TPA: prepilin-type N-terminal cleavage/methylation domain-containing protein [Phycisphaerae bacterium]|nr:prepilin-type N-terminal cleavage/methylation domain-containing protein [Phycisphaerae bacterium]
MPVPHHPNMQPQPSRGLTLIELLVTLILSVLILSMILPLLHQLMSRHPSPLDSKLASVSDFPWKQALEADLRELVGPSKCGIPIFQLLPSSDTRPYTELVLQTFCRSSGSDLNSISRGPSEVRYCLETDSATGPLVLVRYAKGWHDPAAARHVLAEHLTGWTVDFRGVPPVPVQSEASASTASTTTAPAVRPGELVIEQASTTGNMQAFFWVPLLEPLAPAPQDQNQPNPNQQGPQTAVGEGP